MIEIKPYAIYVSVFLSFAVCYLYLCFSFIIFLSFAFSLLSISLSFSLFHSLTISCFLFLFLFSLSLSLCLSLSLWNHCMSDKWPVRNPCFLSIFKYSYGVLLWEIYTEGEVPFKGKTNQEIVGSIKKGQHLEQPARATDSMYETSKDYVNNLLLRLFFVSKKNSTKYLLPFRFEICMVCWIFDSAKRPTFVQVKCLLSQLSGKSPHNLQTEFM